MRPPPVTGERPARVEARAAPGRWSPWNGRRPHPLDDARALLASRTERPTLLAVAHGSADPRAAAITSALLDVVRVRAGRVGAAGLDVRGAYLGHTAPTLPQALDEVAATGQTAVVVLPLLLTDAYHSRTDIPRLLRSWRAARPGLRVIYGRPLGPHPLLLSALERRLAEALDVPTGREEPAAPPWTPGSTRQRTTVVLAAAGSSDQEANAAVAQLAARWRAWRGWRATLTAYASAAAPTPVDAVTAALRTGPGPVLVATYLLAPGRFADQIRRQCLAAGALAVSDVLGAATEVADVTLYRYAEALAAAVP